MMKTLEAVVTAVVGTGVVMGATAVVVAGAVGVVVVEMAVVAVDIAVEGGVVLEEEEGGVSLQKKKGRVGLELEWATPIKVGTITGARTLAILKSRPRKNKDMSAEKKSKVANRSLQAFS
jgi:hypothetical protein